MFESTVDHGAKELWLEDEISEIGGVDADVMSPKSGRRKESVRVVDASGWRSINARRGVGRV